MRRSRLPAAISFVVAAAFVAGACGSSTGGAPAASGAIVGAPVPGSPGTAPAASAPTTSVIPVIVSQQQVVGPNRFVFSFLDPKTNLPAASPDRTAAVAFIAPGDTQPGPAVPATFVWAIEGSRGEYVAKTAFPNSGDWKAVFVTQAPGKPQEAIGVGFQVVDKGTTVAVGAKAPASKTPTAADVGGNLKQLSTDTNPDPAFYQTSVADAVAQGKPFVLIFATPAFCTSAQCGPTLDRVKKVAATAPANVAFINVEPYQLKYADGRLQPILAANGQLQPIQAVNDWGILTEPWIFTVDRTGTVRGSFEGVVGEQELQDAVKQISSS
jgi:hypothetical protein